jgi:PAS domain S-box-containing protein
MALFTRQQYTQATRDTLGTVANQIALGIERKQGEEALRALQQRLHQVITASPAVIYSMHVEDNSLQSLTWVSGNLQRLLGYTNAQALAPDWWYEHVHPEDRAQVLTNLPELFVHGMLLQEYRMRHRDGSYRWVRDERRLQMHTMGQPREIVGSWSDMTVWKHLQEQFQHAQRMEAIGRLAGGVAHDFNNLLTVINGYSGMALGNALLDARMRRQLEEIKKAGERAATLTRQLLAFSRKQMLQPTVVDFNGLLAEMEKMFRHVIGEDIDFTVHYKPDLWRVKADAGQLEQVIMNLVVNARDAMPDGGKLTIETANVTLQENFMTTRREPRVGQYVMVAVSDTGCGIDESIEGRLFEPFFTTKEPGKGTGLGLATVYGIVKQSNGHIGVYSEPGFGTTFKLYLPRYAGETLAEAADPSPVVTRHGTETVLLVEDDDSVRVLAHTILMESGYKVLEARNGLEALLLSEQYGAPIHLLVTDVVMPKISGRQLAERLLLLHPGLKVLYLSGYTDDAVVRHGVVEANVPFLQKPFPPRLLVQKVREVLDG